jgi:hypothetical protein
MAESSFLDVVTSLMDNSMGCFTGLPTEQIPEKQKQLVQRAKEDQPVHIYSNEPPFVKISVADQTEFNTERRGPILLKLLRAIPHGLYRAVFNKTPEPLADEEFLRSLDFTAMCNLLQYHSKERCYYLDLKHFAQLKTFAPFHCWGTVAKFTLKSDSDKSANRHLSPRTFSELYEWHSITLYPSQKADTETTNDRHRHRKNSQYTKSIRVYPLVLVDKNGVGTTKECDQTTDSVEKRKQQDLWQYGKLLLMHNINHALTLGYHTLTHFPVLTWISATKSTLPESDPVYHFLKAHFHYTQGINNLVLNSQGSVLLDHNHLASPFDIDFDTVHKFNIQPAYQHYQFGIRGNYNRHFAYGQMLQAYWDAFRPLVKEVVERNEPEPVHPHLHNWANAIHKQIPSFPNSKELSKNTLVDALTTMVTLVSVDHSAQHCLYSKIPSEAKPWRIRTVPSTATGWVDWDKFNQRIDAFQEEVANHVFFDVDPASLLLHTEYYDEHCKKLPLDYSSFRKRLRDCERRFPWLSLKRVAPSIDF